MKKFLFTFLLFSLSIMMTKAQTACSPIKLDSLSGHYTTLDSFNVQNRYFSFTSNNTTQSVKVFVKNLASIGSNIYVNLYNNYCTSLSSNQVTISPVYTGDTIYITPTNLNQGQQYLIEIGKIINNSTYIVYDIEVNNPSGIASWGCPNGGACTGALPCEYICNGGFEQTSSVPTLYSQLSNAYNWGDANGGTSDLISSLTSPSSFLYSNCNYAGSEAPHTSTCSYNNYYSSSIISSDYYFSPPPDYSEYIQTQLTTSLTPGKYYVISFFISKGEHSNGNLNSLGVWLTNTQMNSPGSGAITSSPSLLITNTTSINNTSGWVNITMCYYATGGENYITIGRPYGALVSLGAPTSTCSQYYQYGPTVAMYYLYVDDVSIKPFSVLATASSQSVNVCGNVNLNGTFPCGNNGLGSMIYSWSGPNVASPSNLNTTATVNSTSFYNLQVIGYDPQGSSCSANSALSVVSNTLAPINISASNTIVCPGNAVTLTASNGASTYTWQPSNLSNPAVYNPTVNTTYTVNGTTSNNCITSKTISINTFTDALTVTSSPNNVCIGKSSTLTASGSVSGYTWQPGNLTGTTVVVSPTTTTVYTITGLSSNNCALTKTLQVVVLVLPVISVSPSNSNTICLNSSITLTASGGSIGSYTWSTGVINPTISLSPTVATTYSVSGTSIFNCAGTTTVSIYVNPKPTVNCSLSNTLICPNINTNLNASGAVSYTWFPVNLTGSVVSVAQASTSTYTVIGTSALGCTNSCVLTQSVSPPNIFTVTATPSVVCGPSGGGTSTLTTPGSPSTYTWFPGGVVNYSLSVTTGSSSSTIYTVNSISNYGCVGSNTVQIFITDANAAIYTPPGICQGTTLNLANGYVGPWPAGTFSVNGVSSSSVFGPTSGTYTIGYTNTTTILCNQTATASIVVYSVPITPTITGNTNFICGGGSLTLTANPSGSGTYSWSPGGYIGNPYILTPTASANYSVTSVNGACAIPSDVYSVGYSSLACNCVQNCTSAYSGTLNFDLPSGQVYCITGNLYFTGNRTLTNCDLKIAPGVTITVMSGSTLNIAGSHLYACDNMWQGIVVQAGGKINVIASGTLTSFIEDAVVAIDLLSNNSYTNTNILKADNVTFNRNQIGIRVSDYITNQTTYPFSVQNCLFTSRTITFTSLTYPLTSTVKNGASGNTSTLQTPYINNSTYPANGMKAPLTGVFPTDGIVIKNVGFTPNNISSFYGIVIGSATTTTGFNCFDNLREDINVYNSNVIFSNNVFQNAQKYGRFNTIGGVGIVANSVTGIDVLGASNCQIKIIAATTNTALNNRFYEKVACADITGYLYTEVSNCQSFCYSNNYANFNAINVYGDRGFNLKTNRYQYMNVQNNSFYNIKNSMLIGIDQGNYFVNNQSGGGKLVGNINILNNMVNGHPTSTTSAEYVNVGISIQDLFPSASASVNTTPGSSSTLIQNNKFLNIHNGVAVSNVGFSPVEVWTNTITLANEPDSWVSVPNQSGINATQLLNNSVINQNKINGVTSYSAGVRAISTNANAILAVRCNTTSYTARGLEFNGIQTISMLEDNTMSNQTNGLVLDNSAKLTSTLSTYVMGTVSRPTNNTWLNTWTSPNFKTGTFNSSSAQDGKLYVQYSNSQLDPAGSATTSGAANLADYFHNLNPNPTLLNVTTTVSPGCRLGGIPNGRLMNDINDENIIALLEQTSADSIIFDEASPEANFINRNTVYRTLEANPHLLSTASLSNFYNASASTSLKTLSDIELYFINGDNVSANSLVSGFVPANVVEANYKLFYTLYLKAKDSTFNYGDTLDLFNLASSCPYTAGAVVYQARSLYNIMNNTYRAFDDNCASILARKKDNVNNDIKVVLKTQVYPNPNNGSYIIKFSHFLEKQNVEISIFDLTGRAIFNENKIVTGNEINMNNNLLNGSYILRVKQQDGKFDSHSLIISR